MRKKGTVENWKLTSHKSKSPVITGSDARQSNRALTKWIKSITIAITRAARPTILSDRSWEIVDARKHGTTAKVKADTQGNLD
jgi:hypothetical protein